MNQQYALTKDDFSSIRTRLYNQTGISLSEAKDAMVYSRLSRRITALSLSSFRDYLTYIDSHPTELDAFVDALTTNKTAFFREMHHFEFLKKWITEQDRSVNIWCAACSSGEEPYSVAMTCADARSQANKSFHVFASDISSQMLAKATSAKYPLSMTKSIPSDYVKKYCQKGKSNQDGLFRIHPALRRSVTLFKQNLLDQQWSVPQSLDVIFCRNVMIYFDKPTQEKLIARFERMLRPGGYYFAGHSESIAKTSASLKHVGKTIYQKTGMS